MRTAAQIAEQMTMAAMCAPFIISSEPSEMKHIPFVIPVRKCDFNSYKCLTLICIINSTHSRLYLKRSLYFYDRNVGYIYTRNLGGVRQIGAGKHVFQRPRLLFDDSKRHLKLSLQIYICFSLYHTHTHTHTHTRQSRILIAVN